MGLMQAGQFKKLEKLYPKYRKKDIRDADIWRIFAHTHSQKQNFRELAFCCEQILNLSPNDTTTLYNLAATCQNLGDSTRAISHYEKLLSIEPTNPHALLNLVHLYQANQEFIPAARHCKQLLIQKDDADTRLLYAQILVNLEEYTAAIEQLASVLKNNPKDVKSLFISAQCLYESKRYAEAEKLYQEVIKLEPDNLKAYNNLGRLFDEIGSLDKAEKYYKHALKIDNHVYLTHLNLGKTLAKTDKLDEAVGVLQKAAELQPAHPEIYLSLGKIFNERNESEKAKQYFEKALNADIETFIKKPEEFVLTVKYYLSAVDNPVEFDDNKKQFIANLFDNYSDTFDKHLVNDLDYTIPEKIGEVLDHYISKPLENALDLGCGTGLCCSHIRKHANYIAGIDIAPKMIEKAELTGCYNDLIVGEISEVVANDSKQYDLIVSADVFIYIGDLKMIFSACKEHTNKDGLFIFSTETLNENEPRGYRQYDSGRFKQTVPYLEELAQNNDFEVVEHIACHIRKEYGKYVDGYISVLRKQ